MERVASGVYPGGITHYAASSSLCGVGEDVPATSVGSDETITGRRRIINSYSVPSKIRIIHSERRPVH